MSLPSGSWELPEELVMLRDTGSRFMAEVVRPLEDTLPHDATGPPHDQLVELQRRARDLGLWALQTPAHFGGASVSGVTPGFCSTPLRPWLPRGHPPNLDTPSSSSPSPD